MSANTINMTRAPNDYDQYYSWDSFDYKSRNTKTKSERVLLVPSKENTEMAMKKSESRSGFSLLTRAASFMTWDTTGTNSRVRHN